MNALLFLLACGGDAALDQPNPPPAPPPILAMKDADIVTLEGVAGQAHGPTRTWVLTAEGGRRHVAHLAANAMLEVDGKPAQVDELPEGYLVNAEGTQLADLLIVRRAVAHAPGTATPDDAPGAPETPAAPGAPETPATPGAPASPGTPATPPAGASTPPAPTAAPSPTTPPPATP